MVEKVLNPFPSSFELYPLDPKSYQSLYSKVCFKVRVLNVFKTSLALAVCTSGRLMKPLISKKKTVLKMSHDLPLVGLWLVPEVTAGI